MLDGGKDEEIDDSNKSCKSMCVLKSSSTLFGQCEGNGGGGENDEYTDVRGQMKFISDIFMSDVWQITVSMK